MQATYNSLYLNMAICVVHWRLEVVLHRPQGHSGTIRPQHFLGYVLGLKSVSSRLCKWVSCSMGTDFLNSSHSLPHIPAKYK